jgi:hypothetical protein
VVANALLTTRFLRGFQLALAGQSGLADGFGESGRIADGDNFLLACGSTSPSSAFNSASFTPFGYRAVATARQLQGSAAVLGKYPYYNAVANASGARRFQVPPRQFDQMSPARQALANKLFLDRQIRAGRTFVLASDPRDPRNMTGAYRREIEYLQRKGYVISEDGATMIKTIR